MQLVPKALSKDEQIMLLSASVHSLQHQVKMLTKQLEQRHVTRTEPDYHPEDMADKRRVKVPQLKSR